MDEAFSTKCRLAESIALFLKLLKSGNIKQKYFFKRNPYMKIILKRGTYTKYDYKRQHQLQAEPPNSQRRTRSDLYSIYYKLQLL